MEQRIIVSGPEAERIEDTGPTHERIEPAEFAAALGAKPAGEIPKGTDLLSLAHLGNDLLKRLRSGAGSVSGDLTRPCTLPLTREDVAALGDIVSAIERATGSRPALDQIARVIARLHLETLKSALRE